MLKQITIDEYHSSDLTNPCMRAVYHRHLAALPGEEHNIKKEMTTALFKGLLAGQLLETIHREQQWDDAALPAMAEVAVEQTVERGRREGRDPTGSVVCNMAENVQEVQERIESYMLRMRDYHSLCDPIGVELPMRFEIPVAEMAPIKFASHIDLAYRNPDGLLVFADFKYQEESPTMAYLARNLQFSMYHMAFAYGLVKTNDTGTDDDWKEFQEQPIAQYIDVRNFSPYKRKTTVKDFETGQERVYEKGDARRLDNIIKEWRFSSDKEEEMKYNLIEKPTIMNAGLFPMSPSKIGCHLCESKVACHNLIHSNQP